VQHCTIIQQQKTRKGRQLNEARRHEDVLKDILNPTLDEGE